ncbi:AlwI family type II restriction endonuclease [Clostridium sp. DL1XJH146]
MSWTWRTKPRSIIKTVQWFPYFASLEGRRWEEKILYSSKFNNQPIHPIRRTYIYDAHSDDDAWLSSISFNDYLYGQKDTKETESNGRNDKTTFEFLGFGYVNSEGNICVTEVGNKIVQGNFDNEDYLKQLLKLRLPNLITKTRDKAQDVGVFPFELVLRAFDKFESLNRSELALLFGCIRQNESISAIEAIQEFKEKYELFHNKNDVVEVKKLFENVFIKYYGNLPNKVNSYYDYSEAFSRSLVYTGLFSLSGRSIATKIRVAEHSKTKVRMLQEKYSFNFPENIHNTDEYMDWYGSSKNVKLPWENEEERRTIIKDKASLLITKLQEVDEGYQKEAELSIKDINNIVQDSNLNKNINDLKIYENLLSDAIVSHNEEYFIKVSSKTKEERKHILEKYNDILDNDDMSALWLEVNTWKSLIAIDGEQHVKRNFKIEDDLTPRSFAPGVGNTPDMEVYKNGYIIIPEVSLMTGVRQWEHEASSVIDHVLSFIKSYEEKQVLGLFISSKMNIRTMWQFFILNRESWVGTPVPVVPLTIKQYMDVIEYIYEKNWNIDDFKSLLEYLSQSTLTFTSYMQWQNSIDNTISLWKQRKVA